MVSSLERQVRRINLEEYDRVSRVQDRPFAPATDAIRRRIVDDAQLNPGSGTARRCGTRRRSTATSWSGWRGSCGPPASARSESRTLRFQANWPSTRVQVELFPDWGPKRRMRRDGPGDPRCAAAGFDAGPAALHDPGGSASAQPSELVLRPKADTAVEGHSERDAFPSGAMLSMANQPSRFFASRHQSQLLPRQGLSHWERLGKRYGHE